MASTSPRLITIGISHFCEKARWALDWHGVPYVEERWALGLHRVLTKLNGAKGTTLPILIDGKTVIQGSGKIIDWADAKVGACGGALTVADARKIEERADARIGVHVRRLAYAAMLPSSGHLVKAELFRNLSPAQRVAGTVMWPVTRRLMIRALDISPRAASESRAILELELDWLDEHLSDGRQYLAGDRFSRADIAVASLLAPFARPPEMPAFQAMVFPPALAADCERWRGRPIMRFVKRQYRDHRAARMASCAA